MKPNVSAVEAIILHGVDLRVGSRVRVKAKPQPSVDHSVLTGKVGIIEAFEQHESRVRVSVVGDKAVNDSFRVPYRLLLTVDEIEPVSSSPIL